MKIVPPAVAKSELSVRCFVCGVCLPKSLTSINDHTNGSQHKENLELVTDNGLIYPENKEELFCKPCGVFLSEEESVPLHVKSEVHANWMVAIDNLIDGEYINFRPYLASDSYDVDCEACYCKVQGSLKSIEEHVNAISHRNNVVNKVKPLNGIFAVANEHEVWCKICDAYIVNTVMSILAHVDDEELHIEWITGIEDLIDGHNVSIENFLKYEHENKAFCNKCQVEIYCNKQSIESHVNSESHLN